jgi:GRASP55/65 PDZ-like domain
LLGVTIRLDNYAGAEDRLVRVLSIDSPKSPAAIAGLVPEKDFLLGTTHQTLDNVDRLAAILRQHEDEVVELYVYNTDEDVVRVIALLPTSNWEGSRGGLLGAEVGTGYLHRLPHTSRNTAGSSVERKVRYIEAEKPIDVSTQQGLERLNGSEKQNAGTHKVLELEPQLEMEPGEDEDHGGRRPHVSPSAVGMTSTEEEQPKQAAESVVPDPSPALQPTNANGVPVLIFTPTIQSASGPPKAPLSGDGLGSHRSSLGNSKYPPSASIPTASPPARTSSSSSNNPPYPTASRYPLPTMHLQQPSPFYGPPPQQQPNPSAVFSQPPPPPAAAALLPNAQSTSQTPPVCGSFPSASIPNAPQQFGFLPPPPKPHVSAQLFAGTQSSNSPTPPLLYPYEQQHQQSYAPNGEHHYSAPQPNEPHESQLQGADSYQRGRSV